MYEVIGKLRLADNHRIYLGSLSTSAAVYEIVLADKSASDTRHFNSDRALALRLMGSVPRRRWSCRHEESLYRC